MYRALINQAVTIGGVSFPNLSTTVDGDGLLSVSKNAAAAKEGTLTTRTDNDTGTLTMSTGHGITTSAKVDIYWDGGNRYNVTVGTVSGNSVPIDLGSGDNLPVADTTIYVRVLEVENFVVEGDDIQVMAFTSLYEGRITLRDASSAVLFSEYLSAGETYYWYAASGVTNPVAGDSVAEVAFSHSNTEGTCAMKVALLYN